MGANEDSGKRNLKSGTPKKPFIYYYFLVILAVMVLNALVFPMTTNMRMGATQDIRKLKSGEAFVWISPVKFSTSAFCSRLTRSSPGIGPVL